MDTQHLYKPWMSTIHQKFLHQPPPVIDTFSRTQSHQRYLQTHKSWSSPSHSSRSPTLLLPLSTPDHDTKYFYPIHSSDAAYLLEKRAITCALTGSNVRYRKCPSTDANRCPGIGESGPAGTKVAFVCYTLGSKAGGLLLLG